MDHKLFGGTYENQYKFQRGLDASLIACIVMLEGSKILWTLKNFSIDMGTIFAKRAHWSRAYGILINNEERAHPYLNTNKGRIEDIGTIELRLECDNGVDTGTNATANIYARLLPNDLIIWEVRSKEIPNISVQSQGTSIQFFQLIDDVTVVWVQWMKKDGK